MIKIISKDGKERIWKSSEKKNLPIKNNDFKLPKYIEDKVFWVPDEYRTNPLSLKKGGSNVIVEFYNEKILGYERIKFPSSYIKKILGKEISNIYIGFEYYTKIKKITTLRKEISTIHARKYNENNYNEIWNSKDTNELPWDILKLYDMPKKYN